MPQARLLLAAQRCGETCETGANAPPPAFAPSRPAPPLSRISSSTAHTPAASARLARRGLTNAAAERSRLASVSQRAVGSGSWASARRARRAGGTEQLTGPVQKRPGLAAAARREGGAHRARGAEEHGAEADARRDVRQRGHGGLPAGTRAAARPPRGAQRSTTTPVSLREATLLPRRAVSPELTALYGGR